jgi:hypothetical protein
MPCCSFPTYRMLLSQCRSPDIVNNVEIVQLHWDITKLLEMGINEEWAGQLTPAEARDLVKGLLYLRERYRGWEDDERGRR